MTVSELRGQWIDACLEYDELRTQQLVNQAFALYSPETVVVELLQRAIAQIGEGWYQGTVTVQQEHFCSGLVTRRLEALVMAAPPPSRSGRILVACPPQEQHVIGPLLLTYLLRRRGWEVAYLGANVPVERLEIMTAVTKPQLVISAAQQLHTAATLMEMAQLLQTQDVPLAYGGLIFNLLPALRQRITGRFLGEQLEAAPGIVESLMTVAQPLPTPEPVPEAYQQAREHFQERQSLIEAHVLQALNSTGYAHNRLALANRELGTNISAALALGDMDYLGTDIEWVTGLLRNHRLPNEALFEYLRVYYQTAVEQLDDRGQPITDWLGKLVGGQMPVEQE
jgi:methanogenic corrinoid protein MtbC1